MSDEAATLPEWAKQLQEALMQSQEALIQSNDALRRDQESHEVLRRKDHDALLESQETLRRDLLDKIERLQIDVNRVTQYERRQARVGPYSDPIRPEVEPSNNSHGAFIWETRPASPRFS
jgi:hypothetical protein